ncbi:MAG: hypothetical protein ACK2TU_11115, partial [Anaerolineales bacterium]
ETIILLAGKKYDYAWKLIKDLGEKNPEWQLKEDIPENETYNHQLHLKYNYVIDVFRYATNKY